MSQLLTVHQVQDLLRVDRTTIYRMAQAGRIPAIRVGKQWRFDPVRLQQWLNEKAILAHLNHVPQPASELSAWLPVGCAQMIQDAFAEVLGVMMLTTDLAGQPFTAVSQPCGFFTALVGEADALMSTWKQLVAEPALEPRFIRSAIGLCFARGAIRAGNRLIGIVIAGGVAEADWPPAEHEWRSWARRFGANESVVQAHLNSVYRFDADGRTRILHTIQRVADIFSHVALIRQEGDHA
jgi:excisionase family DNA binding protein